MARNRIVLTDLSTRAVSVVFSIVSTAAEARIVRRRELRRGRETAARAERDTEGVELEDLRAE